MKSGRYYFPVILVLVTACAYKLNPGAEALKRLTVGMTRSEVPVQLADAWHTDNCVVKFDKLGEPFDRRDIFWFGPEDVARANVVVVVYTPTTEQDWVVDRFELAEQYLIDDFYGDCTSLDLSPLMSPTIAP